MKERLTSNCAFSSAERYVVTGAVPSTNHFIPQKDIIIEDIPDRGVERVNVPSHVWSAVCCDASHSKNSTARSYFFGVVGENKAGGSLTKYSDYNSMIGKIRELYGSREIDLLVDECSTPNPDADVVG